MRAGVESGTSLIDEPQIRLVNERGRDERRLPVLSTELAVRQAP